MIVNEERALEPLETNNRIHRLKYLQSTALGYKNIGIRQSDFIPKTIKAFSISKKYSSHDHLPMGEQIESIFIIAGMH